MFNLQHNDFPVDTHVSVSRNSWHLIFVFLWIKRIENKIQNRWKQVFEIAKRLGWVPKMADRNKTYVHLNRRIPDELKFDLNCLLYTHGKLCSNCKKNAAKPKAKVASPSPDDCPLVGFSDLV